MDQLIDLSFGSLGNTGMDMASVDYSNASKAVEVGMSIGTIDLCTAGSFDHDRFNGFDAADIHIAGILLCCIHVIPSLSLSLPINLHISYRLSLKYTRAICQGPSMYLCIYVCQGAAIMRQHLERCDWKI